MNIALRKEEETDIGQELLTSPQAHALLDKLTGVEREDYEFYNLIRSGLLGVHSRTVANRMLFARETIEETARLLSLQPGEAPQEKPLSTQEALSYLEDKGFALKRSTFHKHAHALKVRGLMRMYSAPNHPKRPYYLFSREGLDNMIVDLEKERTHAQELEAQGLLTPRQAAVYLSKKHNRRVTIDLVYSKINRGAITPDREEMIGGNKQFYLKKADLDALEVGPARVPREPQEARKPIQITYLQDIKKFEKQFKSRMLTKYGVLKLFYERTGKEYGEDALKQMRRRGTLEPIAVIGRTFLYLEKEAKAVHLLPATGRRVAHPQEESEDDDGALELEE